MLRLMRKFMYLRAGALRSWGGTPQEGSGCTLRDTVRAYSMKNPIPLAPNGTAEARPMMTSSGKDGFEMGPQICLLCSFPHPGEEALTGGVHR